MTKGRIFDEALYRYIDADETQTFRYAMFLAEIPSDFAGVRSVSYADSKITVMEVGRSGRKLSLEAFELF